VQAAFDWIRRHYTVDDNPGMGTDGLYYYYITFARALAALNEPTIGLVKGEGMVTDQRDWRRDLVEKLATLQNEDGSFKSVDDRWMENDPVLITAYALIALREATN
jgi:squalene-hopene/tetraprenyl-beta-curcumene cyclase